MARRLETRVESAVKMAFGMLAKDVGVSTGAVVVVPSGPLAQDGGNAIAAALIADRLHVREVAYVLPDGDDAEDHARPRLLLVTE